MVTEKIMSRALSDVGQDVHGSGSDVSVRDVNDREVKNASERLGGRQGVELGHDVQHAGPDVSVKDVN